MSSLHLPGAAVLSGFLEAQKKQYNTVQFRNSQVPQPVAWYVGLPTFPARAPVSLFVTV